MQRILIDQTAVAAIHLNTTRALAFESNERSNGIQGICMRTPTLRVYQVTIFGSGRAECIGTRTTG